MDNIEKGHKVRRRGVRAVFTAELMPFADDIIGGLDDMMARGLVLKDDHTCAVSMAVIGGRRVIIKRYNNKGLIHVLRQNCKPSRAARCWRWGRRLLAAGVATPAPYGYMEVRKYGLRQCSYLFTEYLDGGMDFARALTIAPDADQRQRLSLAVDEMVDALERKRILHNDLKPPNVMIAGGVPYLIDLDSMRRMIFPGGFLEKGKDREHLVLKMARQGVETDERFNIIDN